MEITIVGAGNMGCVYGGNLARVGQSVTMFDLWQEHVDAIRANGLQMTGQNGEFTAELGATTDASQVPKADLAIILVNTYNTPDAAQVAKTILKPDGCVLTLQNGMGNVDVLIDVLGQQRVMAGLSFHSGDLTAPGQVIHTNFGPTYLGELDKSRSERLLALHDLMDQAGLNPVLEPDIMATIWGKFVHNCAINAICAITDLRPGNFQEVPAVDEFQTAILEETLALVAAKGIELPEKRPIEAVKEYCKKKFHRVSMMQHLKRGRMTEIDALNGYVARESAALGTPAPYNDALTKMIKGLQHLSINKTEVGN